MTLLLLVALAAFSRGDVDVVRYEVSVHIADTSLDVTTTRHAAGEPPDEWRLELVPEMSVTSAECDGSAIRYERSGAQLVLQGGSIPTSNGEFRVTIRCSGAPEERFSAERGGYVRSVVDAPGDRQVRTAGDFGPPRSVGGRGTWSFTTDLTDHRGAQAPGS